MKIEEKIVPLKRVFLFLLTPLHRNIESIKRDMTREV